MSIKQVVRLLFVAILSCFYSSLVLISFLFRPKWLFGGFFKKPKSDKPPECLNDPDLGTHGFVHLEEVRIHYVAAGTEGKPLMLLVHGFPEFWYSWRFQLREFSKEYRVVAVDQRGYGESDKPSGIMNYTTDKLSQDLKQLIPALGYRDCILVGHDWGGAVVFNFANKYPEMVKKLIVMNAPHGAVMFKELQTSRKQFLMSWYMFFFQMPFLPEFMLSHGHCSSLDMMFRGKDKKRIKNCTEEDIEAYKYNFAKKGNGFTGPLNYYRAAMRKPFDKSVFNPIEVPTLIIWGVEDIALNRRLPELGRQYIKDCTIKYIDEASHWVQMDGYEEANKYIWEFVKA
ncbi:epoxide hydrolase 4-like [Saccostrea echinata]|uniref:epoxide hydrolase 4-like n=1 Tax=Saccostrea echinata TaxID=191078 RepID=UPI002A80F4C3|nr:epoxide hydrolase 4-like [Saccostrea echinata]